MAVATSTISFGEGCAMANDSSGPGYSFSDAPAGSEAKRFRVLTADDLLAFEFPPRETLLTPWLPSKGLAMIYGPRGIGKTHLTLGCGYAIASGGKFLRWTATEARRVLLLDGEMPGVVLQERMARIIEAANEAPPSPEF